MGHEGEHGVKAPPIFVPTHGQGVGGEDRRGEGDVILGVAGRLQAAELQQQAGHAQLLLYKPLRRQENNRRMAFLSGSLKRI